MTRAAWHVVLTAPAVSKTFREVVVAKSFLEEMSLVVRFPEVARSPLHWDVKLRVGCSDPGQTFACQCQCSRVENAQKTKNHEQYLGG